MHYAHPHGHVFYRKMAHHRPKVVAAEGVYLTDEDGRRYLDASGGPLVVNVGHGRQSVIDAMAEQAQKTAYAHAVMFTTDVAETYSERIARHLPFDHARLFYLSSGSEVIEAAMKLARQIQMARGQSTRHVVISRTQSYHGMTLGALGASGRDGLRAPYLQMLAPGCHVSPPYPYRDRRSGEEMAAELEAKILEVGAENVAAFLAEPISGASLGAAAPPDDYWPAVRSMCDRHGVLLIADEVLVGFGRTGRFWALSRWNVRPDILVSSKGTAGGYMPFGFVATEHAAVENIRTTLGDFNHGGTFSHHPVALAAALATLDLIESEHLVENAKSMGVKLGEKLKRTLNDHPHVGDIRGEGLFWGIELVDDRSSKRPFSVSDKLAWRVFEHAFSRGVIVYFSQGCANGKDGDLVMVGPPFIVTDEHLDTIASVLREAIAAALVDIGRG